MEEGILGIADEVPTETDQGITTKGGTTTGETTKDNEETKTPNDTDTGTPQPPTEKKEEVFKFKENISNLVYLIYRFYHKARGR